MTKYIIGEIFSSGEATLYKNPSDKTVRPTATTDVLLCAAVLLGIFVSKWFYISTDTVPQFCHGQALFLLYVLRMRSVA